MEGKTFGQVVRNLRIAKGKRLRKAAIELGITAPYLSKIEQDQVAPPSPSIIEKFACYYGIAKECLMMRAPNRRHIEILKGLDCRSDNAERLALFRRLQDADRELIHELLIQVYEVLGKTEEEMLSDLEQLRRDPIKPVVKEPGQLNMFEARVRVKHLSKSAIERIADDVLKEHGLTHTHYYPPTPVEDIVEIPGQINVILTDEWDTADEDAVPSILGMSRWSAMYPGEREIVISAKLFESIDFQVRARLNFTLAHEYFHARYHLPLIILEHKRKDLNSPGIESSSDISSISISRISDKKEKRKKTISTNNKQRQIQSPERWCEWQADFFAACLLMPRHSLETEFEERFGSVRLQCPATMTKKEFARKIVKTSRNPNWVNNPSLCELYAVNPSSMVFRIIELGLIV